MGRTSPTQKDPVCIYPSYPSHCGVLGLAGVEGSRNRTWLKVLIPQSIYHHHHHHHLLFVLAPPRDIDLSLTHTPPPPLPSLPPLPAVLQSSPGPIHLAKPTSGHK